MHPYIWIYKLEITPYGPVNRITTVASGINVNVIRSPAFMARLSRIALGIVVCPLLVSVASFDMSGALFPDESNYGEANDCRQYFDDLLWATVLTAC